MTKKNSLWCTSYLRNHISYDCHLWYTFVKWWYLQVFFFFFHFFKILILWVVRGCKWAKNDPKWEKILSVVVLISGIIHHMIFIMVLMLKMIIPRSFFYFSKILIFWVVGRVQGQKWPKMARNSVFCTLYIRNHTSYDLDIWYTCVKG